MARIPETIEWQQALKPIKSQTLLADQVYENLSHAILTRKIKPGQHLVEQPLADQLAVSRISVREAIRRLAQDGLVEIIPSKGSYVVNLTAEDVKEIYQLRSALEMIALKEIMANNHPNLAPLDRIVAQMIALEQKEDRLQGAALDNQFHRTLMNLSGLTRTIRIWEQMSTQITMVIYTVSSHYPSYEGLVERHAKLVYLIRSGNYDNAESYLREHIQQGAELLLSAMSQTN
ncbi:MAG: GntR family transcriptional regulator [Anaerolineaceae bacterium]|nr:GntR family transcriptional regulator [Anaerolineaceae bacterium]